MAMIDPNIARFGTTEALPSQVQLRAGPVTATLENGALRWIKLGEVELLRGVAFLVRDRTWDTPTPVITELAINQGDRGFRVTFKALCRTGDGDLPWTAEIVGEADGTICFVGTTNPTKDFLTQRTGFVVLHPLQGVAGCPVEVTHTDGTKRRARFPAAIDPEQCFFDIRALSHQAVPGLWATCTMEGDAWEMEDHRNWLDASFKTYVRPLALPHPYTIAAGSVVRQSVTLALSGIVPASRIVSSDAPIEISVGDDTGTHMPAIGLRAPLQWLDESLAAMEIARLAHPQLLAGRIDPRLGHDSNEIKRLAALATGLGAELTLELVVPGRRDPLEELSDFATQLRASGAKPESVTVALAEDRIRLEPGAPPPPLALLAATYQAARQALPGVIIGGGAFGFFTELNRNWPPVGLIDYVTHVTCSLVHAADDRSMVENLESFGHMARSVEAFAGTLPYRMGASGLGLDIGPYGPPAANPDGTRRTMVRMDPRHRGLFGAAWTLASIGEMARAGLSAINPAAVAGEFGIVHCRCDYTQPWFDDQGQRAVYPIFHIVAGMAAAAGRSSLTTQASREGVVAVAHRGRDGGAVLWLANMTDAPQRIAVPDAVRASILDEGTFAAAAHDPAFMTESARPVGSSALTIHPYATMRIELRR